MAAYDYGSYLPPELELQKQQLNRQQEMAKALLAQGQQMSQGPAGQMVSGQYVANSPLQMLQGPVNQLVGAWLGSKGDESSTKLVKALRDREMADIEQYTDLFKGREATPEMRTELAGPYGANMGEGMNVPRPEAVVPARAAITANPEQANMFAASSYSPILRQMGLKKLTEGPKWEKAEMPQPDGSVRTGWINTISPNPKDTFVEGGVKPAYTAMEAAKFTYDTGMAPPSGAPRSYVANPPVVGAPAVGGAPVGNAPMANIPMVSTPTVGGMRPSGMSPSAANAASKEIFVDKAKRQAEYAEQAPAAIEAMKQTIFNVNNLIGDAKVVKNEKTGKEEIVYGKIAPHEGFKSAVGAPTFSSGFGVAGYLPATDTTNFKERLEQIKGETFLQAFNTLKGAGQITEQEGTKATAALNRMSKSLSEVEFVKAAREFEENIQKGMELSRKRAGMPSGNTGSWRVK
jgi:hypothetical protein